MAKLQITALRRTAIAKDDFRIVVIDKDGEERTLSTPIAKLNKGTAFRKTGGVRPIEQYGFQVGKKEVERFDEAAALVMRRHNVQVLEDAKVPAYAARAVEMLATA